MEFFLIIALIIFIAVLTQKPDPRIDLNVAARLVVEKKSCPPHQWFWQEVVDQHGNSVGERLICKVCGPIASQSGREE